MTDPWETTLRILERRAHGPTELGAKLRARGFEDVSALVERARELHLLETDEAVAERYARQLRRKGSTPLAARAKLLRRGFDSSVSERATEQAFSDWDGKAEALAMLDSEQPSERVARRLSRRGFRADDIRWALARVRERRRTDDS